MNDGLPPAVACYWHGAHYEGETCGGAATATDFSGHDSLIGELLTRQRDAVEQRLRDLLLTRGVNPDDRTPGWEDRARAALADLETVESFELSDDYRASITTTIRPRTQP